MDHGVSSTPDATTASATSHELASEFVTAFDAGDSVAVSELFDARGAIQADRYAWRSDEISAWAHVQVAESAYTQLDATQLQAIPNHLHWAATVRRQDWTGRGIASVRMSNVIWTDDHRVVDYIGSPIDQTLVPRLGELWQPYIPRDRFWAPGSDVAQFERGDDVVLLVAIIAAASAAALVSLSGYPSRIHMEARIRLRPPLGPGSSTRVEEACVLPHAASMLVGAQPVAVVSCVGVARS